MALSLGSLKTFFKSSLGILLPGDFLEVFEAGWPGALIQEKKASERWRTHCCTGWRSEQEMYIPGGSILPECPLPRGHFLSGLDTQMAHCGGLYGFFHCW